MKRSTVKDIVYVLDLIRSEYGWLDDDAVVLAVWEARERLRGALARMIGPWEPDRAYRYDGIARDLPRTRRAVRRDATDPGHFAARVSLEWDMDEDTYTLCEGDAREVGRRGNPFSERVLAKKITEMNMRLQQQGLLLVPGTLPPGWVGSEGGKEP